MGFWKDRTRRRPYGRRPHSHPLVEDVGYFGKQYTPYSWLYPQSLAVDRALWRTWRPGAVDAWGMPVSGELAPRTKAVPMPHGGVRYLFRCQLCDSWRQHLYNMVACSFLCRRCLGLRYKSQYSGRRVDASRERLDQARVILERAEAVIRQQRKQERNLRRAASARLRRQQATWRARRKRFNRAEFAYEWRREVADWRELVRVSAYSPGAAPPARRHQARGGVTPDGSAQAAVRSHALAGFRAREEEERPLDIQWPLCVRLWYPG